MHPGNHCLGTVDVTVVCVVDVKVCVAAPGQKHALEADSGHVPNKIISRNLNLSGVVKIKPLSCQACFSLIHIE